MAQVVLTLPVSLGELDLDLTPTNPFTVQVVKSVLCVTHIFKRAELLRAFILKFEMVGQIMLHIFTTTITKKKAATQINRTSQWYTATGLESVQ